MLATVTLKKFYAIWIKKISQNWNKDENVGTINVAFWLANDCNIK